MAGNPLSLFDLSSGIFRVIRKENTQSFACISASDGDPLKKLADKAKRSGRFSILTSRDEDGHITVLTLELLDEFTVSPEEVRMSLVEKDCRGDYFDPREKS